MFLRKAKNSISRVCDEVRTNKSNKSENNVSSDDDNDINLPSDYSTQAVVSYSDSNDLLLENDVNNDDEDYYMEQAITDDEVDEIQKRVRNLDKPIIKGLSRPSKHRPQKAVIHGKNSRFGGGDFIDGQDGNFVGEKLSSGGGDDGGGDGGEDVLERWRRRRRLEKLKMEHERKMLDSVRYDELGKLDDILSTSKTSHVMSNMPPPIHPDVMVNQYHQFPIYYQHPHQSFQPHQQQFKTQQQQQCHSHIQPLNPPIQPVKQTKITKDQHQNRPFKIHLHNVSKCCCCTKSPISRDKQDLPIDSKSGGDCYDIDIPTKDPGPLEDSTIKHVKRPHQRICMQTQTSHDRPRSWDLSREIDKNNKINSALESSLGHNSGSRPDKKAAQGREQAAINIPDKELFQSNNKNSRFQPQVYRHYNFRRGRFDQNEDKILFNNEMNQIHENSNFQDDLDKNVCNNFELNHDNVLPKDLDLMAYSLTTVSSLDVGDDYDEVIANHVRDHHAPTKTDNKGLSLKDRFAKWLSRSSKGSKSGKGVVRREVVSTNNYYHRCAVPASLNSLNDLEPGTEVEENSCGEVDDRLSEISDMEHLLNVSDGEEFPDDEILRGLRKKRDECLRVIEHFNKLLPP